MHYAQIREIDSTNCLGVGVSIFVSGCTHHCKGCFNSETWDFKYGEEFTEKELQTLKDLVSRDYIDCFSILGGEPFEDNNIPTVLKIVREIRSIDKNLKIFIWSGYTFEQLIERPVCLEALKLCDYLIDGEFKKELKDDKLILRGSSNQRVIDLKKTFDNSKIFLINC